MVNATVIVVVYEWISIVYCHFTRQRCQYDVGAALAIGLVVFVACGVSGVVDSDAGGAQVGCFSYGSAGTGALRNYV